MSVPFSRITTTLADWFRVSRKAVDLGRTLDGALAQAFVIARSMPPALAARGGVNPIQPDQALFDSIILVRVAGPTLPADLRAVSFKWWRPIRCK